MEHNIQYIWDRTHNKRNTTANAITRKAWDNAQNANLHTIRVALYSPELEIMACFWRGLYRMSMKQYIKALKKEYEEKGLVFMGLVWDEKPDMTEYVNNLIIAGFKVNKYKYMVKSKEVAEPGVVFAPWIVETALEPIGCNLPNAIPAYAKTIPVEKLNIDTQLNNE